MSPLVTGRLLAALPIVTTAWSPATDKSKRIATHARLGLSLLLAPRLSLVLTSPTVEARRLEGTA